ncbi:FAD-dependent monooxygenase [Xenorhabdus innexi]|uniref:Flavin dependent hydroxylase PhzS n=1 Tax=Xenorhabdus innexi TaxID=290109 RepID=A0A1N6MXT6_9GAMM|nr:FAD-dependent monooxygenase [Xenorhabdus innexi]PHM38857.1 flavin dependent hydroxylase PhzS [Xenorhabdus innexi]SIP73698.1 putative Aromatic-ring hydroxylase [Xenorhabdus innexi]
MSRPLKVIIAGAGIGGLTTAVVLRKLGYEVEVYEQAPTLRTAGSGLSVITNAVAALSSIGVNLKLENFGAPVKNFEIRNIQDHLIRRMPVPDISSSNGFDSICLSRKALQEALLQQLDQNIIHVDAKVDEIIESDNAVSVRFTDGREAQGDLLIGADGIHSIVREYIQGNKPLRSSDYICWLAITRYQHPQITPGYVVHYWGQGKRIGLIDIGGGEVYWWGTANMSNEQACHWQGNNQDVLSYYKGWPTIVSDIISQTPSEDIIAVPAQDRPFSPIWGKGRMTLLGDAAHPMLTTLGQGAGMAIEDAAVLGHMLKQQSDPVAALRQYEKVRIPRAEQFVNASKTQSDLEQEYDLLDCQERERSLHSLPEETLRKDFEKFLHFPVEDLALYAV